jgi:hypothetical protein
MEFENVIIVGTLDEAESPPKPYPLDALVLDDWLQSEEVCDTAFCATLADTLFHPIWRIFLSPMPMRRRPCILWWNVRNDWVQREFRVSAFQEDQTFHMVMDRPNLCIDVSVESVRNDCVQLAAVSVTENATAFSDLCQVSFHCDSDGAVSVTFGLYPCSASSALRG